MPVVRDKPGIISQKRALAFKWSFCPSKILKCLSTVGRACERECRLSILWIPAPVVKLDVNVTRNRIHREPLKKLIGAIVKGIVVHAHRTRTGAAVIGARCRKHINIAVSVVAPG